MGIASVHPLAGRVPSFVNAAEGGHSAGKFPVNPRQFYSVFRDRWPEFVKANFRNSTEAASFFGVDEKTARGWIEGHTAPRGQVVALTIVTMPEQSKQFLTGAA